MIDAVRRQFHKRQIEEHLQSAMAALTPDVLGRVDLGAPQEPAAQMPEHILPFRRRLQHTFAVAAAACLCMVVLGGGVYTYQNGRVDSVIGIDVNPSVELAVNRRDKVLKATPLNADAVEIMDDMDLKGVDLNVAVNAVIGSMVQHGYLDDLDNAILVTVSNDSVSKAANLRSAVVEDIQVSLEENQVKAVVYDQQAVEMDEVKQLAGEYEISYGKAYFLKELIDQNPVLTMDDMESLAPLTMEEIAQEITDSAYALGERTDKTEESSTAVLTQATTQRESTTPEDTEAPSTETDTSAELSASEKEPATDPQAGTSSPETTLASTAASTEAPSQSETEQTTGEAVSEKNTIKIDYVDCEDGVVTVNFKTKVKWKNPTVSVKDDQGTAYSAMVGDTSSSSCEILVSGLEGGYTYTFVLGGISPKVGKSTTVRGTFEAPVVSEEATKGEDPGADDEDGDDGDGTDDSRPTEGTTAPEKDTSAVESGSGTSEPAPSESERESTAPDESTPAPAGSSAAEQVTTAAPTTAATTAAATTAATAAASAQTGATVSSSGSALLRGRPRSAGTGDWISRSG